MYKKKYGEYKEHTNETDNKVQYVVPWMALWEWGNAINVTADFPD